MLLRLVADFRAIAQQQLQASQSLHLQQTAQGVIAVMECQRLGWRLFKHGVEVLTIVAFGNDPQVHTAGSEQGGQIHFAVLYEGRQHFAINTPYGQAVAHGAEHRR
ncbi:hypothetical protein D3C71_1928470 [compost metagenome]